MLRGCLPKDSGDPVPAAKIAVIEQWIKEGAKLDAGLKPESNLLRELRVRWKPPVPPTKYKYPVTITALAFTPDNKKLVAGGHHELTIWDVATGKLEKRLRTRAERAYDMVFLPDGKLIVAGGRPGQEGDVRFYDLNGRAKMEEGIAILDGVGDKSVLLGQILEAEDSVLCLDLSKDGKRLVSGGTDRLVHVWDLSKGIADPQKLQTIENHADWVFDVKLAADGKHLLTCSRDKTAKVWDLSAKQSVMTFPSHQSPVYGVSMKADSKVGYSVGEDKQLRSWNVGGNRKQIRAAGGFGATVFKVIHHPTQPLLATCSADRNVRLHNEANLAVTRTLAGHTDWVFEVAFSPGRQVDCVGFLQRRDPHLERRRRQGGQHVQRLAVSGSLRSRVRREVVR